MKKILTYLIGLLIIALGINISKLSRLGISPVSSIPGVLHAMNPDLSLGSAVIIVYCVLVFAQFAVLRKKFEPKRILGVLVALVFGLMVDCLGTEQFRITLAGIDLGISRTFRGLFLLLNISTPESILSRFILLLISIAVIGIGVYVYLKPNLVPMPAEGLADAISRKTGKSFGNCKTCVDVSLISIAAVLQILFLGGIKTLGLGQGTVGIGTVLAAVSVGQVVKFIKNLK